MKLGIVGSRNCDIRVEQLEYIIGRLFKDKKIDKVTEIISGGADGADTLSDAVARKRGIKMTIYYPKISEFKTKGKAIFFERNKKIAEECDALLALYNPAKRSGTANTVKYAKEFKKPIFIVNYEDSKRHISSWDYDLKKIV